MSPEELAPALARELQPLRRPSGRSTGLDTDGVTSALASAVEAFRSPRENPTYQKAAEWFLDNYYLIARSARQITTEIPAGFWRRLPHAGPGDVPRALAIARAFVAAASLDFDEPTLVTFVHVFQRSAPLTIAELWALPAMLRLATLESLGVALSGFFPPPGLPTTIPPGRLDGAVCVERSVRTLRLLAEIDWKAFFEHTSVVDAALREDPAAVYTRMAFEARDAYRKVVEEVAWETKQSELEVARAAIDLASLHADDARAGHVGYYLVDRGQSVWKREVGYRPRGLAWLREAMLARPTLVYLGSIFVATVAMVAGIAWPLRDTLAPAVLAAACGLASIPLSSIAVAFTNWVVVRLLPPRALPKLDFSDGVPDDCRTLVVIPALVARPADVDALFAQLELHHLSSAGPSLSFALLTDYVDTPQAPDPTEILARADALLKELNAKYAGGKSVGPFHFLHRESRWNEAEDCFMGWERKRGKLEELNQLLRGDRTTSYTHVAGDPGGLERIRFVVTLDADTQLPLGAVQQLVGLAAHPLNVALFDERTGNVVDGYTVVQPRVETHRGTAAPSLYGQLCAGDTTLDIYTHAVSDVYQDLFGAGSYVGKGIYDVDAFSRSVRGRVPDNALCSHDLFEGIHGRTALATEVFVLEQCPQNVVGATRRHHRWIRGDWQLAPWLFPRVPGAHGRTLANPLRFVDRWRIFDNLRRSLLAPSTLALVLLGIAVLPPHLAGWALAPLLAPLVVLTPDLLGSPWREALARWGMGLAALPHDAWLAVDAIVRTLARMTFTRRHLLEWVTAAHTAHSVDRGSHALFWREIGPSSVLVALVALALALRHGGTPWVVAPVLALWLVSPEIARRLSAARRVPRTVSSADRRRLRRLARRTWSFFETFVTPGDQWLPPDNFQEHPGRVVAHRTSPTNIGLMLVAYLGAFDFGYVGRAELRALVRHSLDTLDRLERYRGHLLNWYDTRTLDPLLPRYVSTVDSGNLGAALIVLARGCREAAATTAIRSVRWLGLLDTLGLLEEALDRLRLSHAPTLTVVASLHREITRAYEVPAERDDSTRRVAEALIPELETALLAALAERTTAEDLAAMREVRTWYDGLKHQVRSMVADLAAQSEPSTDLAAELASLAERADAMRAAMDFTFLYDWKRKLFHIGYNATSDRLDVNHYDLLASEARVASFLALVQRQVPAGHWAMLGRPITRIHGGAALLSWGGTMFEYLMPSLFMRSQEHSLLAQSVELAVAAQIDYGRTTDTPWGVSESGFAQLDARENYQYRSFGVPSIGLRRGLEDDLVIAPYASLLAIGVRPREVVDNLDALEELGAMGRHGLYEAVDFHGAERRPSIVKSHMAHHQGMILAALDNFLNGDALVDRFHSDALVQAGTALLSERLPSLRAAEQLAPVVKEPPERHAAPTPTFPGWVPDRAGPQVALLGNGHLTTMLTDTGAGFVRWNGLAVTGVEDDPTCDVDGTWLYVRDERSGRVWSAAPAPTRARLPTDEVVFHAHQVELHHRDEGISLRTQIGVAPNNDVEVRHVTLHNESDEARTLTLISYAEPVLAPRASARRHPAFSRMFVQCEPLDDQHGVLAWRRKRDPDEPSVVVVQRLVWDDGASISWIGSETDRGAFVGRRRTMRAPALTIGTGARGEEATATLDPAITLAVRVELAPRSRAQVALITAVGSTRAETLDLSRRFGSLHAARWAIHDAKQEVARQLDRAGMTPELLPNAMQVASRLVVPGAALRPPREPLTAGPTRSQLWGHGISGDEPLLVVRVQDPARTPLVREVLTLHRLLRRWQVPVELVFLDATASGYQADEAGRLREVIAGLGMADRIGERAGVRVFAVDQLAPRDRARLVASARVLLDADRGSLTEQLALAPPLPPPLPEFLGTAPPDLATADIALPSDLLFANGTGGFTPDGREYVLRTGPTLTTPAPWCNVLANAEFGCLVSESALGTTWSGNSGENRLTPWRNDPVSDAPSEILYLRDEETAQVWSSTPLPAGMDAVTLVRHGAGYTTYERESHGLRQTLTVFVPVDASAKIVRLAVTNRSDRARRLTATYYAEWVLGALREEQRAHIRVEYDATAECLLAASAWNDEHGSRVAFLAADRPTHGLTCDRTELLGRSGAYDRPTALGRWGLSGTTDAAADPCAALQIHIELGPGESGVAHFVLGEGADRDEAIALARRFRAPLEVDRSLAAVHARWDRLLGAVRVKTPEPAMDILLNRWLLYQTMSSRFLARSGFYQSSGAFGFRDQLQDTMGFVHVAPGLVREHLLRSAAHQFEEGDVLHWWHPPMDRGVRTRCSDDMVWLPFVVAHYVSVTGDVSVLQEQVPFLTGTQLAPDEHDRFSEFARGTAPATLLDHCRRALVRASTEGPHGLPLMGAGDWNDGMSRVGEGGRGESIWLAWFLCATMRDFARLCDRIGEPAEASRWRARGIALGARVDAVGWDGAWYLRAFYDDGSAMGTSRARNCRIDSIVQSWAVLSGAADARKSERAIESAEAMLVLEKERLVLVLAPPFQGGLHHPGYIEAYPPGVRENGGQYTHAATWLGWAHAHLGDGAAAERIFQLLNPILRAVDSESVDRYRIEPYVLAADVYSVSPLSGRGGWSWYTGAAAWMWRLGVEAILGLAQRDGELHVDPCIPPHWPGFEATVRIGEEELHVIVENPHGVGRGVTSVTREGRELRVVLGDVAKVAE